MAAVRFVDVQARPTEFLDLTSLTPDEFEQLIPPFEDDFQDHMARWRLDGKPRTARRFAVYKNCPLPTPHDRLFFLLTYLKTYSLQVMAGAGLTLVQGRLFGMSQGKANHIPSDLVATPRSSHNRLDFSMPYPHDVSFSPGGCFKGVDLPSGSPSKLIAVDEEPNDQIVHALGFGETDCPTHQPLDPSP